MLTTIGTFISIIVGLISLITWPLKMLWRFIKWLWPFTLKKQKEKLGLIEGTWREHYWEYGKSGDKEVILIHTDWKITNTLSYNLTALNAYLTRPQKTKGSVMVKDPHSQYHGHYPIPQNVTTDMSISFVIDKKHAKNENKILKLNLEIEDPIGIRHQIKGISVRNIRTRSNKKEIEPLSVENPTKIKHKTLKKVVSILKNEIEQYKVRGRKEGRLGTIEWPRGVMEWRKEGESIRFLNENSNKSNVKSDQITKLVRLYKASPKDDKRKIMKFVKDRIDAEQEYLDIAYFIVFFLFEIGELSLGLKTAVEKLKNDKSVSLGDVFRLIDILLTFRFKEFGEKELDVIEAVVYSTGEHTFRIKQRVNAIRVDL
jgi:hypothetical protein